MAVHRWIHSLWKLTVWLKPWMDKRSCEKCRNLSTIWTVKNAALYQIDECCSQIYPQAVDKKNRIVSYSQPGAITMISDGSLIFNALFRFAHKARRMWKNVVDSAWFCWQVVHNPTFFFINPHKLFTGALVRPLGAACGWLLPDRMV